MRTEGLFKISSCVTIFNPPIGCFPSISAKPPPIPSNNLFEKTYSNLAEVKARGGKIICISDEDGKKKLEDLSGLIFIIKNCNYYLQPIVTALPVQLLAYHIACFKGTDVDQPRNLAKSVTVE